MASICSKCQSPIPDDAALCPTCGADAPTDPNPQAQTQPGPEPETFVGPDAKTQPLMASIAVGPSVLDKLAASLGSNYQVRRVVGRGGFAEVYEVWDRNLERRLAAKVLSPEVVSTPGAHARFKQEAKTVAQLSHPAILPIHFVGDSDELAFYVMPFVEGDSLRDRLDQQGRLSADEAISIAKPILEALGHAHDAGLIHRDIKPDNVMLDAKTGRALLVDFGIAKVLDPEKASNLTQAGFTVGTPHFMSPEQALGDRLDARSDLYSFGAMLFEMVSGKKPYEGNSSQEVVMQHVADPIPEAADVEQSVPIWLSDLVVRCMQKLPDDRFQTATEILDALAEQAATGGRASADDVVVGDIIVGSNLSFDTYEMMTPTYQGPSAPVEEESPTETAPSPEPPPPTAGETPPEEEPLEVLSSVTPEAAPVSETEPEPEPPPRDSAPEVDHTSVQMAATAAAAAVREERRLSQEDKKARRSRPKVAVILPLLAVAGAGGWLGGTAQGRAWFNTRWAAFKQQIAEVTSRGSGVTGGAFHQYVTNSLIESVELLVDGQVARTLGPGVRDSLPITGQPPVLSWRLIRPTSRDGREMGNVFSSAMSAGVQTEGQGGSDTHFAITGVAVNRAMFTPIVTNPSSGPMVALINGGTPSQASCNCVIPAGGQDVAIGYYSLLDNSTIRFYDARSGFRGPYRQVTVFASRVNDLSGAFPVSVPTR